MFSGKISSQLGTVGVLKQGDTVLFLANFDVDVQALFLGLAVNDGLAGVEHAVVIHFFQEVGRLAPLSLLSLVLLLSQRLGFFGLEGLSDVLWRLLLTCALRSLALGANQRSGKTLEINVMRLWRKRERFRLLPKLDFVDEAVFDLSLVTSLLLAFLVKLLKLVNLGDGLAISLALKNSRGEGQAFSLSKGLVFFLSLLYPLLKVFLSALHQVIGVILLSRHLASGELSRFFVEGGLAHRLGLFGRLDSLCGALGHHEVLAVHSQLMEPVADLLNLVRSHLIVTVLIKAANTSVLFGDGGWEHPAELVAEYS